MPKEAVIAAYTSPAHNTVIQHKYVCVAVSKLWESVFIFPLGYGKSAGIQFEAGNSLHVSHAWCFLPEQNEQGFPPGCVAAAPAAPGQSG